MTLSPEQEALLPSNEDVAFFQEHGWYRARQVVPTPLLDEAIAASDRHFRGERDWRLPIDGGFSDWKPTDGDVIRNAQAVALQSATLRELAWNPILAAIAGKLSGTYEIRYFDDSVIYKPAELPSSESVVGWHTDRAYWGTCTSERMLTAWIPFQDTPVEMGPVEYIDGSHAWPGADQMRTFHAKDLAEIEQRFGFDSANVQSHPMTLQKGDVSFHSCLTVHGSRVNVSDRPRIAMALHFQDGANRYRHHLDGNGQPWHLFNDDLARRLADGTPDYADPAIFPVLWSSSATSPA